MRLDLKNLVRELDIILDRSGEVSARAVAFALKVSLKADGPQGIDRVQSQLVDLAADLGRVARRVDRLEKAASKSPAPLYAGTCPLTMVPVDAGKPDAPADAAAPKLMWERNGRAREWGLRDAEGCRLVVLFGVTDADRETILRALESQEPDAARTAAGEAAY